VIDLDFITKSKKVSTVICVEKREYIRNVNKRYAGMFGI